MSSWKEKTSSLLHSRRFWIAVAGVAATIFHDTLGVSEQQTMEVCGIVIAWVLGDSLRKTQ